MLLDEGRIVQPSPSLFWLSTSIFSFGFSNPMKYAFILQPAAEHWPKTWIKYTTCRCCVWPSALHYAGSRQSFRSTLYDPAAPAAGTKTEDDAWDDGPPGKASTKTARRLLPNQTKNFRSQNHSLKYLKPRILHRQRKRGAPITHSNGRTTIDDSAHTIQMLKLWRISIVFPQRHWDRKRSNTCSDWNNRHRLPNNLVKKAPFTTPCCCVPLLNAVPVAQTLRRLEANFFCTFTRNIRQTTTKPVHLSLTCNIWLAMLSFINSVADLIKNVQISPTRKIDFKLKEPVARLIRSKGAKLSAVWRRGAQQRRGNIWGSSGQSCLEHAIRRSIRAHIENVSGGAPPCMDCVKIFCIMIGKAIVCSCLPSPTFSASWKLSGASIGAIARCSTSMSHPRLRQRLSTYPRLSYGVKILGFQPTLGLRLSYGVKMLGTMPCHCETALIPMKTESEPRSTCTLRLRTQRPAHHDSTELQAPRLEDSTSLQTPR